MNLPNRAPALDAAESDWGDYLDNLSDQQLSDVHGSVIQFGVKNPEQAKFVENLRAMIESKMVRRFPGLVDRVKYLEYALNLGERDVANLAKEVA